MAVRRGRSGLEVVGGGALVEECECVRSRFGTKRRRASEADLSEEGVAPAEVRQARVSTQ